MGGSGSGVHDHGGPSRAPAEGSFLAGGAPPRPPAEGSLLAGGAPPRAPAEGSAKIFNRFVWSGGGFAVKAVLTLATLAVLARLLTPTEFGLVAVAWIVLDLTARLGQTAVGHLLMQSDKLGARDIDGVFTLALALGATCSAAIWLLAPAIAAFSDAAALADLLRLLAFAPLVASFSVVPAHLLRRELRQPALLAADSSAYFIGYSCVATILALNGWGAWAPIIGELVRTAIHVGVVAALHRGRFPPRLALRGTRALAARAAGYLLTQASGFVLNSAASLAVWHTLGTAALGYYSRAERLAMLPTQAFHNTFFDVSFVATAQRQARRRQLRWYYLQAAEGLALAALPASLLLAIAAPEVVALMLGAQWPASVPILQVLALAIPMQAWGTLNAATMRGLGGVYRETWRQAVYAGVLVAGAWLGTRHGLLGVAVGVVAAHLLGNLALAQAATMLDLRWPALWRSLGPALWTAGCATPPTWALLAWLRQADSPPFLALAAAVAAWGTAAFVALRFAPRQLQPSSLQTLSAVMRHDALKAGMRALTAHHAPVAPPPAPKPKGPPTPPPSRPHDAR